MYERFLWIRFGRIYVQTLIAIGKGSKWKRNEEEK